ncbi:MAG: DNA polymerase III subunit delta [Gammaproteobacteria bacterium]|nr:DNA polymerase III subunit delta [Gammaproteobacteria bacterium]
MRLRPEQLTSHLRGDLLPVYLLSGEEPLQMAEAADAIRAAARARGYTERAVLHVESGFEWSSLLATAQGLSLFAERRIIELRITGTKVGDEGAKTLTAYAQAASTDNLLLVTLGKPDKQLPKWLTALEAVGAFIQIWPVDGAQLPAWIGRRMQSRGLQATPDAVQLLADRVEGNLLAAAQEIDKLRLLYGEGRVDAAQVAEAVANSARFGTFELLDAALAGDGVRAARILQGLRAEGVEPLAVLGVLLWEGRNLVGVAGEAPVTGVDAAMAKYRIWDKRKPLVRAALTRHKPRQWQRLLLLGARIDRQVKGQEPGNPWDELLQLALFIAGVRVV